MNKNRNYKFLITGGNFTNKGAQSMLFIAVDQIKRRFPNSDIYALPIDDYRKYDSNLLFHAIQNHPDIYKLDGKITTLLFLIIKNIARVLARKKTYIFKELFEYPKLMRSLDCIIDISGFCLSSQFGEEYNRGLINNINEAKKYNIPIVLMPQSFGPFEYKCNKEQMLKDIREALCYPCKIFAREPSGFKLLQGSFNITDVTLSPDLVLQNKGIDLHNIFVNPPVPRNIDILNNSVALVPNSMNASQTDGDRVVDYYKFIINRLLENHKNVYILSHSGMDKEMASKLYYLFKDNKNVYLINKELMCYEYDLVVKQMNFIVASRYHSIVHAYKNKIPCIILGWADKYKELAHLMNQNDYVFDVRNFDAQNIEIAIDDMCMSFVENKKIIEVALHSVQKDNCFDVLNDLVN